MGTPERTGWPGRPEVEWRLRTRSLQLGRRTLLMGVLNVTPDSFSDGGRFLSLEEAVMRALYLLDNGADILDVGGESTRPGERLPVSVEEETARVVPVIEEVLRQRPAAVVSIDTYKAATARAALAAGAEIVNDVSGLLWDGAMGAACAELDAGVVLMHTRGRPSEWKRLPPLQEDEVLPLVQQGLAACLARARAAGIGEEHIVLDPGYGFGKAFDANYALLSRQPELLSLGRPLLAGVSRKSFLRRTLEQAGQFSHAALESATTGANVAAVLLGASILRVHEPAMLRYAVAAADAITSPRV